MTALDSAIEDLKDRIENSGFTQDLIALVAEEWEIQPTLLERMFEQKKGRKPAEWKGISPEQKLGVARKAAEKFAFMFARSAKSVEVDGKEVPLPGLKISTAAGRDVVLVAMVPGGVAVIAPGKTESEQLNFDMHFGGEEGFLKAIREACA